MEGSREGRPEAATERATMERRSARELVVSRRFASPARALFEAFAKPALFERWWVPRSFGLSLVSCALDVRVGGQYRLVFRHGDSEPMAFFGTYLEVTPDLRLRWTNDEGEGAGPVTTVSFEPAGAQTLLVMHESYPSEEALDAALGSGEKSCLDETFDQLEALLAAEKG